MNKSDGTFDFSKFFMGLAVAIVFVMQQYHAMQLANVKENYVPRHEIRADNREMVDSVKENYMTRAEILELLEGKK